MAGHGNGYESTWKEAIGDNLCTIHAFVWKWGSPWHQNRYPGRVSKRALHNRSAAWSLERPCSHDNHETRQWQCGRDNAPNVKSKIKASCDIDGASHVGSISDQVWKCEISSSHPFHISGGNILINMLAAFTPLNKAAPIPGRLIFYPDDGWRFLSKRFQKTSSSFDMYVWW